MGKGKDWLNQVLWDTARITLSLGAVGATWVPMMNFFHNEAIPTFILEIPVFYVAELLVTKGVMKALHWSRNG